jgi:ribonuclease VapC
MIVVDTSALMAIVLSEPEAAACMDVLEAEPEVVISAATLAEALIVAGRRNVADEMSALIEGLGFTVEPLSAAGARQAALAYARWGRGVHAAALNFGDSFAYAVAKTHDCPLLYVGEDFARTDVTGAAARGGAGVERAGNSFGP